MFTCRTFAQFLFNFFFQRGRGDIKETFGNSGGEVSLFFFTEMDIPER